MTTYTHSNVTADAAIAALASGGFEIGPAARSTRTVLDTFDGRLHAAGLRLEHRDGIEPGLVLDGGTGAPRARLDSATIPRWPADLPPGPFRGRVAAVTRERALLPALAVRSNVRVARRLDRRGKVVAAIEVHLDLAVPGSSTAAPPWAAEVLPVAGHADAAADACRLLVALGVDERHGDVASIAAAAAGVSLTGHAASPTVPLEPDEDALVGYRRVLANLAATIDDNLPGTIDDIDPEFLHELRVAVRRTRSVLAQARDVLPTEVSARFRDDFKWLGDVTTTPRDLDVHVLGWDAYIAPIDGDATVLAPVRAELVARRAHAHEELAATLQGERGRHVLDDWRAWLADPSVVAPERQAVGPVVARRIGRLQRKVLRDGRAITPDSPGERLHDLRKGAKKLRYMLECFGSLLDPKPRKAFVRRLKSLQDNLGEHQDAEVHAEQLQAIARELRDRPSVSVDALLALGRIIEHLDRRRRDEREQFAARFAAYDTAENADAFAQLLRPAYTT